MIVSGNGLPRSDMASRNTQAGISATRRQLLEYAALYDVDEIFLFDADAECLYRAHFPHLAQRRNGGAPSWRHLVGGLVVLAVAAAVWRFT